MRTWQTGNKGSERVFGVLGNFVQSLFDESVDEEHLIRRNVYLRLLCLGVLEILPVNLRRYCEFEWSRSGIINVLHTRRCDEGSGTSSVTPEKNFAILAPCALMYLLMVAIPGPSPSIVLLLLTPDRILEMEIRFTRCAIVTCPSAIAKSSGDTRAGLMKR
jgi:hypothetical protein